MRLRQRWSETLKQEDNDGGLDENNDSEEQDHTADHSERDDLEEQEDFKDVFRSAKWRKGEQRPIVAEMCSYTWKSRGTALEREGSARLFTEKDINAYNVMLRDDTGPNSTTQEKLDQLKVHQFLHVAYQRKDISIDMLGYYLDFFAETREMMIEAIENNAPKYFDLGRRLSKFPPGWVVLADRGFAYDALRHPNLNPHITPAFVGGRDKITLEGLMSDKTTCKLRYTVEVRFANTTHTTSLQDVIPF